jgi:HlyD family secretion protein
MHRQLYPAEYAEDSLEQLLSERSRHSHAVYLLVVAALLVGLALLPLVRVDVSVQSAGIIRPGTEKHEVKARASGLVDQLLVRENAQVHAGQPLLVLRSAAIEERARALAAQTDEHRRSIADLDLVVRAGTMGTTVAEPRNFQTSRYRQTWAQFRNDLREAEPRRERAAHEAERARALGSRNMASASEVEEKEFQLAQARAAASLLRDKYLTAWQGELAQARGELRDLVAQQEKLSEEMKLYEVAAPVTGTVEQMQGVSAGSFVVAGEPIAVISPNSELQAEIYVTPRDIGTIRQGMPVRLQVDAFNYNDWGMATGRVREISGDFVTVDQQPVFKVKCSLDQDHLTLKSGFHGRLKKGMTFRARFVVARRSLLQLLYENVNDWLNPAQATTVATRTR